MDNYDCTEYAIDALEKSQGDVRNEEYKQRLTQLAQVYAAIAQAQALTKIAEQLEELNAALGRMSDDSPLQVKVWQ